MVHGDILTYRMDRGFPAAISKPWQEGRTISVYLPRCAMCRESEELTRARARLHRSTEPSRHREPALQRLNPPHHQVA